MNLRLSFSERCHAFTEHPEKSWVLCEREDRHEGPHKAGDLEWDDPADEWAAELRELLRRAEQEAGESYEE